MIFGAAQQQAAHRRCLPRTVPDKEDHAQPEKQRQHAVHGKFFGKLNGQGVQRGIPQKGAQQKGGGFQIRLGQNLQNLRHKSVQFLEQALGKAAVEYGQQVGGCPQNQRGQQRRQRKVNRFDQHRKSSIWQDYIILLAICKFCGIIFYRKSVSGRGEIPHRR